MSRRQGGRESALVESDLATDLVRCMVLVFLHDKPRHGYAIMELLQARLGRPVSPGIIYPFLGGLSKSGYSTSKREREGGRTRILYSMTSEGKRFSKRVFRRLSKITSLAVGPSLSFCANCGCKLYEGGYVQEIDGRKVTFCCVHCARAYIKQ